MLRTLSIASAALAAACLLSRPRAPAQPRASAWPAREALQRALGGRRLPAVLVHLPTLDANADAFAALARRHGKTIRLASKSVRVPALLRRCQQRHPDVFVGLMCYSAAEASFLFETEGFDDLLVAYPTVQVADVAAAQRVAAAGGLIRLMVDCPEHVRRLDALWTDPSCKLRVCVDLDMAYRVAGQHLGALRSPCRSAADVRAVAAAVAASRSLELDALMGYEAQVAGLPDASPLASRGFNWAARALKALSMGDVRARRAAAAAAIDGCRVVNGGGTGSAAASARDPALTEITVGSGLLQCQLMDWYDARVPSAPAFCFALQVTRACAPGRVVTCHGGGFVASGAVGADKAPRAFLPAGAAPSADEGFGEVQTPLLDSSLGIGDVAFFRPAKAGEIAERFSEYLLVGASGAIEGEAKTYRGLGGTFH